MIVLQNCITNTIFCVIHVIYEAKYNRKNNVPEAEEEYKLFGGACVGGIGNGEG